MCLLWVTPPPGGPRSEARAGTRSGTAGAFRFDRFQPPGLGISIYKPTTLTLRPAAKRRRGYRGFSGTEPRTRTRFTLYVMKKSRSRGALARDAAALAGVKASQWAKILARPRGQGFAWQEGYHGQPGAGKTVSALLLRHGTRPIVYILVVRVALATAVRHLAAFRKAYAGLKALP